MKCKTCNGTGRQPDHKAIGLKLKRARTKNEIGLRVMARRLGISHSFLHQLENGQRRWSPLLQARFITHLYQ